MFVCLCSWLQLYHGCHSEAECHSLGCFPLAVCGSMLGAQTFWFWRLRGTAKNKHTSPRWASTWQPGGLFVWIFMVNRLCTGSIKIALSSALIFLFWDETLDSLLFTQKDEGNSCIGFSKAGSPCLIFADIINACTLQFFLVCFRNIVAWLRYHV